MAAKKPEQGEAYDGPVCYLDGWHYTVVADPSGSETPEGRPHEIPGDRLYLDDDGAYRYATDDDTASWHDRKHVGYARIAMEGGQAGLDVSPEEFEAIQEMLRERREA